MSDELIVLLLFLLGIGAVASILVWHFNTDKFSKIAQEVPDYKGLCLFDIDGTLSTGTENEKVVQYCLDRGYAVGIATAGSMYTPSNLTLYSWMPKNLYHFMEMNEFDTFNNVASGILTGRHNSAAYTQTLTRKPPEIFWPGWLKGVALEKTGLHYGLSDPASLILFDNDPSFISGTKKYNSNFKVVCAGMPCNGTLTLDSVKAILE